ncbi:hypothetical protein AB4851_10140 [Burkholderia sp. 22PA0099]|uniref:hypothetical protein n=1 Tax=Burkholderia sp. 22PA0099 TaxID=3237372 RepID=UPI0039C1B564
MLSVSRFFGTTLGTSLLVMAIALPSPSFALAFLAAGTLAFVAVFWCDAARRRFVERHS